MFEIECCVSVDGVFAAELWGIYDRAMSTIRRLSPYKQSMKEQEFLHAMRDMRYLKYVLRKNGALNGFAMVVTDMSAIDAWLEPEYFAHHFCDRPVRFLVGNSMTLGSERSVRGNAYLINRIVDDAIEAGAVFCTDNSVAVHPRMMDYCKTVAARKKLDQVVGDSLVFLGVCSST